MRRSISRIIPLVLLLLSLAGLQNGNAQFIHLQMEIETALSADVVQELSFGNVISSSGINRIEKGSSQMGIFEIRGLNNQPMVVNLHPPDHLEHTSDKIEQNIPVSLEASYSTGGTAGIDDAKPFQEENYAHFSLSKGISSSSLRWVSAYVYIYGNVEVGQVPKGTYEGTLVLSVEYQ